MNRWSAPIFLAGLVIGWIFLPTPLDVCGYYRSESLPAWVQAIGSVLAIIAAVVLAWWQQWQQTRNARAATAKLMAVRNERLYSALTTLGTSAQRIAADWRVANRDIEHDRFDFAGASQLIHDGTLYVDYGVREHESMLHEFELPISKATINLLASVDQYKELQGRLSSRDAEDVRRELPRVVGWLESCAEQISMQSFKAANLLRLAQEMATYPDIRKRVEAARAKAKVDAGS